MTVRLTTPAEESGSGLLSIGAFSRASLLSIKKLRAYHEAGILVPAEVHPRTGYRMYHWSQLVDAALVRKLRALGLPLEQVKKVVDASDPAFTRSVLESHRHAVEGRLAEVLQALEDTDVALADPDSYTPVCIREVPPVPVVAMSGEVGEDDFANFLGKAYPRLYQAVADLELSVAGPSGALYPHEIADEVVEIEAFLPLAGDNKPHRDDVDGGVSFVELPAVSAAVLVHAGGYDTISESYRLLGAWVARNAQPAPLPVREEYQVSYGETDDPARFRTAILWPVRS